MDTDKLADSDRVDQRAPAPLTRAIPLAILLALAACTDPDGAQYGLRQHGYTEITTGDFCWNSCWMPMTNTCFRATHPAGHRVSGVVCGTVDGRHEIQLD